MRETNGASEGRQSNAGWVSVATSGGYYVVYRGSKESAVAGLQAALKAMEAVAEHLGPGKEPEIQPDDGKHYA